MTDILAVKKGDFLIDSDQIYQVVSVADGKVCYKSHAGSNSKVKCTIPSENLEIAGFRKLMSEKEIKEMMARIGEKGDKENYNNKMVNEVVWSNDIEKIIPLLSEIYLLTLANPEACKREQELVDDLSNMLAREAAFVLKKDEEEVVKDIKKRLKKTLA